MIPIRTQELCESPGGLPGLPLPNKLDGFCGRKATSKLIRIMLAGFSSLRHLDLEGQGRQPTARRSKWRDIHQSHLMALAIKQALFPIVINRRVLLPLRHVSNDVWLGGRLSSGGGQTGKGRYDGLGL